MEFKAIREMSASLKRFFILSSVGEVEWRAFIHVELVFGGQVK
tara:strand:- start:537 stop:665 length:129 start_codon:yes stop_codon:yes gene_type:complete